MVKIRVRIWYKYHTIENYFFLICFFPFFAISCRRQFIIIYTKTETRLKLKRLDKTCKR